MKQELTRQMAVPINPKEERSFFDPRMPEQPDDILGIDTDAVLRLSTAVTDLHLLPPRAEQGVYKLPTAIRILPLIEKMQQEGGLAPEDVRPYRKPIKRIVPGLNAADRLAAGAGALAVGVPLRRRLNQRVEREFPQRASEAIRTAREQVAVVERQVDFVAGFENPRAQFEKEISEIAEQTRREIIGHNRRRVFHHEETEPPAGRGVRGFFTKMFRKVRDFFSPWRRKSSTNPNVTAYDAAAGIEKVFRSVAQGGEATKKRLPLLSGLVLNRLSSDKLPSRNKLALAAPEILSAIFSMSPKNEEDDELLASITQNPHEFRFITKYKSRYGHYDRALVRRGMRNLLPAIRDVLPTDGQEVRNVFDRLNGLMLADTEFKEEDASEERDAQVGARPKWWQLRRRLQKRTKH